MIWTKIVIFILLFIAAASFFYLMKKQDVLANILKETSEALDNRALEQARADQRSIHLQEERVQGKLEKILGKPRNRFLYSRLGRMVPGLTFEIWFVIKGIFMVIVYVAVFTFSRSEMISFCSVAAFWLILYFVEYMMAHHNYKVVDDNLIKFVDLLGNFSTTSGEITGILYKVSYHLPEPLSSVLKECYYDAQTYGDTSAALYSMAAKIENPKFKELVRNLESCVRYTANFKASVDSNRRVIIDERKHKRARHDAARDAVINMALVIIGFVVALVVVDFLIQESIWTIWTGTVIGRVGLIAIAGILLTFYVNVMKAER